MSHSDFEGLPELPEPPLLPATASLPVFPEFLSLEEPAAKKPKITNTNPVAITRPLRPDIMTISPMI
jgi:hypothetical protein